MVQFCLIDMLHVKENTDIYNSGVIFLVWYGEISVGSNDFQSHLKNLLS